ncbi:MAG: type II 3-dehydroquinate dehydratase [Bacteriovoracaceae bacterium]
MNLKILVINGPNLNLLGTREPEIYGDKTLSDIEKYTNDRLGKEFHLDWFQSNIEGEIVSRIQQIMKEDYQALVINPAGYAHTSVVILDALKMLSIPIAEVHLSNIYKRESFRHSMLTASASNIIMGGLSYRVYYTASMALSDLIQRL